MAFVDSYAVDDFKQLYPDPLRPFQQFSNNGLWVFRDCNWSTDFPTSVCQTLTLYRPPNPVTVADVIAEDQYTVQSVIDMVGSMTLPGEIGPITEQNLVDFSTAPGHLRMDGLTQFGGEIASLLWSHCRNCRGQLQRGGVDWLVLLKAGLVFCWKRNISSFTWWIPVYTRYWQSGTGTADYIR